jgi:CBS domain-containing protein
MRTGEVCSRSVVAATRDMPLAEASRLMRENHVGSLVVTGEGEKRVPVGIVTDRDIVVEVVAAGLDHQTLTVGEIMGSSVATAREDDDTLETLDLMRLRGVRRVPVVDAAGELVGIVSIDDLLESVANELSNIVLALRSGPAIEFLRRR